MMTDVSGRNFGRYQIVEEAGSGGMATVYKAFDTRLGNHIALKVIRMDRLAPEIAKKSLARFEREAKSLAKLAHPNIIKVLDYGEVDGNPYIVMDYLTGGTLKGRLSGRVIGWQEALNFLLPVAEAMSFAHGHGIIHRDIKPSNILINQFYQPILSDFGIAKLLDEEQTHDLSSTGMVLGTPEYMSPEQATGAAFDHRVDIYSLGIVLYEMVTGRKPFRADTPIGVLVKQASEPLPRPTKFNSNLPAGVENILIKMLAKDPRQRFQSMNEVIAAFRGLLNTGGRAGAAAAGSSRISVLPGTPAAPRTATSKPWLAGLIGGVVFVLLCVVGMVAGLMLNFLPFGTGRAATEPPIVEPTAAPTEFILPSPLPRPTDTGVPTSTPVLATPTMVMPSCQLEMCNNSNGDICVYGISPQPTELIISLKVEGDIDTSNLPHLLVGGDLFPCDTLVGYPGRLFCNGQSLVGKTDVVVVSSSNQPICGGSFTVKEYVEPVPTKRERNEPGNHYP